MFTDDPVAELVINEEPLTGTVSFIVVVMTFTDVVVVVGGDGVVLVAVIVVVVAVEGVAGRTV